MSDPMKRGVTRARLDWCKEIDALGTDVLGSPAKTMARVIADRAWYVPLVREPACIEGASEAPHPQSLLTWEGISELAKRAGRSERRARDAVSALKRAGYIVEHERKHGRNRLPRTSLLVLARPDAGGLTVPLRIDAETGVLLTPPAGHPRRNRHDDPSGRSARERSDVFDGAPGRSWQNDRTVSAERPDASVPPPCTPYKEGSSRDPGETREGSDSRARPREPHPANVHPSTRESRPEAKPADVELKEQIDELGYQLRREIGLRAYERGAPLEQLPAFDEWFDAPERHQKFREAAKRLDLHEAFDDRDFEDIAEHFAYEFVRREWGAITQGQLPLERYEYPDELIGPHAHDRHDAWVVSSYFAKLQPPPEECADRLADCWVSLGRWLSAEAVPFTEGAKLACEWYARERERIGPFPVPQYLPEQVERAIVEELERRDCEREARLEALAARYEESGDSDEAESDASRFDEAAGGGDADVDAVV